MAYPFHRLPAQGDTANLLQAGRTDWSAVLSARPGFKRAPAWQRFHYGHRASLVEPMEPRLLLSADFMPAAAEAMADGLGDFQDRLDDFLISASDLDERIPFLLKATDEAEEGGDPEDVPNAFEAPTVGDMFGIPVDTNGNGFIGGFGSEDELLLQTWDGGPGGDGFVTTAELLDALLFAPLEDILADVAAVDVEGGDDPLDVIDVIDALVNNLNLDTGEDGLDVVLNDLGGYQLAFDLISASDLTEQPDAEIALDLQFSLTITQNNVPIDLGLEADELKLLAFSNASSSLNPEPATVDVTSTLTFGLEFGVYTGGQEDADLGAEDFFIRRADDLLFAVSATDNDLDFNLNIGFLGARVVDGAVDLLVEIPTTLVDPDSPEVLGFDTAQYGVEQSSGVVTAANPLPAADLPHDAGFVLRIGNIGIATDITLADTNAPDDATLIADLQAAVAAAGFEGLVEVDLTGTGEVRFSLVDTQAGALGFNSESLGLFGSLDAFGVPTDNQPAANISFLLSVAGALPRLVTIRAPGAEREDIGFGENQDATLGTLVAQSAANSTGTLADPDGAPTDTIANFELRITESDGTVTTGQVAVSENTVAGPNPNASVADLVQDINASLAVAVTDGAALDTLVSASESGGVISFTGAAGVTAIEVIAADTVTETDIGLANGQSVFLSLEAANPVGDPSFDDGVANTFDGARFTVTINELDTEIDIAADGARTTAADLADAIDQALVDAGLALTAEAVAGSIVLTATDNSVESFSISTGNQNLGDLVYDLNNALDAAGFDGVTAPEVTATENIGVIRLTVAGGETLEITRTLTFDAGVRGAELDGNPAPKEDASFATEMGANSHLLLALPVEVKAGLDDGSTPATDNYDPQDLAIVGNVNPFTSSLVDFVADDGDPIEPKPINRYDLGYSVTAGAVPNPVPEDTLSLVNFAEVLQFNRIGPGAFIGMLTELGQALDSMMEDGAFSDYGIPFTEASLADLVAFEDMINNGLIYDTGPNGVFDPDNPTDDAARLLFRTDQDGDGTYETLPFFTTAQEMGALLANFLSLPLFDNVGVTGGDAINPTYNPDSNELTYDVDIISSDRVSVGVDDPQTGATEAFTPAFAFNVDLSPFGDFSIVPPGVDGTQPEDLLVEIEARTGFSATYGFDLTPDLLDEDGQDTLENRFFVRNAILHGAFTASLPSGGVGGTALLGLIGVDVNVDGSFGAQFSAQLRDEGGVAGSQVSLETLQNDIVDSRTGGQDGLQVITDPVVSKLQTLDYDAQDGTTYSNFGPGSRIVSDSGGSAHVLGVIDNGTTGTAILFGVEGAFNDDDVFVDMRDVGAGSPQRGGVANGALATPDDFSELTMSVAVQPGFDAGGYFGSAISTALNGLSGTVDLDLVGFGDPNNDLLPVVDATELNADLGAIGDLTNYIALGYEDLIDALEGLRDLVAGLEEAYPVLSTILPVVNRSVSDLLNITENVDRAVASARTVLTEQAELLGEENVEIPTLTLQEMATALRSVFGIDVADAAGLVIDVETRGGNPYLTLDFDIEETVSTSLGLDIDLGGALPNLTSGKVLRADGSLGWGFKVGINLNNPSDVVLFNPEGGLDGDLSIIGEGAEGVGAVFLAQVGDASVQVMDALIDIQLDFDLGGLDFSGTDGIKALGDVEFGDFIPNIDTQDYNISIPLFDPAGGLTGFLGEIVASGSSIIDDAGALLADGLLDTNALEDLENVVDEFIANLEDFDILDNLQLLTDAVDLFLETLQDILDQVTSIGIPIVGDNLADGARFIESFRDDFISEFRQLVEITNDISVDDVSDFINDFFVDVGLDIIVEGVRNAGDDLNDLLDDEIVWSLQLGGTYDVPFDLGFDLGIPLLRMDLDVPIEVGFAWDLDIGFGVNKADGAFIALADGGGKELDVDLIVDLPAPEDNEAFRGELGFLEVVVKNNGSGLQFDFDVDLSNSAGGDKLPIADLGNLAFDTDIGGGKLDNNDHILDLELEVGVIGADVVIPRMVTDFVMDWSLGEQALDFGENLIQAGLELLDFQDVQIDLSDFLGGFLGDVLGELNGFLAPLAEITDALNDPIPILADLFDLVGLAERDQVTLLWMAEILLGEDTETGYIQWIDAISGLISTLSSVSGSGEEVLISIGDLEVFGGLAGDPFGGALFDGDASIDKILDDAGQTFDQFIGAGVDAFNSIGDAINDAVTNNPGITSTSTYNTYQNDLSDVDLGDLFSFPFLDNPQSILGLLIGQDVSLIQVDIPELGVGFDYEQFFSIFGPLGASVGFGFYVGADFSFGFDTYGLGRFAKSEFTNPGLIFDGFFFGDREAGDDGDVTTGTDIEEVFLEMTLTAAAELNLGIARGGVGGGITARIGWDWYDPDNDGAVHISEIVNTLEAALRDGFDIEDPLSIFDLKGALLAELFWYLVIDFGLFEFEAGDTIFGPETIFTFEYSFGRDPILATVVGDTLVLNMGPNAIDRLNGDTSDGNELFEVDYEGGDIRVRSPVLGVNDWQVYGKNETDSGSFSHVIALGGQGNDAITFEDFDATNITFNLQGGVGDDIIEFIEDLGVSAAAGAGAVIRGGAGNDRLIGSHLDDEIYGGLGNDTIEGGRGYDVLFGDDGDYQKSAVAGNDRSINTRVSALDGDDSIDGGADDDIIIGGGGEDTLKGDGGRDVILGDAGRFGFDLTGGHINVDAFAIGEFVPNDRLDDSPAVSTEDKIQAILRDLTGIFTGTDLGDGADDDIEGGDGDDIIFGGAANDTVRAGAGDDHVVGGKGFDTIDGDADDDVLFGNEQDDIITGGAGSDVIAGGFGDDVLHGNEGDDYMTGSRGRDIMYGDADNDELVGQGEPDIMFGGTGDDLVVGGAGADIMMGDDGIVVKFDGVSPGVDLVIGNGNAALANAYEAGADDIFGSLDLILTDPVAGDGDDILSGGEGGDIILGGGGNDLGGGDVDPRSSTANVDDPDTSTPNGEDILIGDGGVVEFNQRRLQRIASVVDNDPTRFRDTLYGDNGDDVIIGGQGSDGDDNGADPTLNIPSLGIGFMLTGGHGPGRGPTDAEVSDEDVIIGDNGELVYVGPGDENFGELAYIQTTDTSNSTGGADTAFGEEGNDIILGGVNGSVDVLSGSTGEDVILGDNGLIHFYYDWAADASIDDYATEDYADNDGDPSTIDLVRSFHDGLGGVDVVSGEEDSDLLLGGEAGDLIYGDDATASSGAADLGDVMLGDNGDIFLDGVLDGAPADAYVGGREVQGQAIDLITTTDVAEGTGGADVMSGNAGADVIIGGVNGPIIENGIDKLYGDAETPAPALDGDDLILGDNGLLDYTWDAAPGGPDTDRDSLDLIETTATASGVRGGVDYIFGNAGSDTVFGGTAGDRIFGDNDESSDGSGNADTYGTGGGADILVGDQGRVELVNNLVTFITTTDANASEGGVDHIEGNDYGDYILGGVAGDELHGEAFLYPGKGVADLVTTAGADTLLGDEGSLRFDVADSAVLVEITEEYDAMGDGNPLTLDVIETFATDSLGGDDTIYGNGGDDVSMGGFGDDLIHGDFYLGSLVRALNPGSDELLGDGGQKYFQNGHVILLRTSEYGEGGSDEIHGNDGDDTIAGGAFADLLYGETDAANLSLAAGRAGEDIILGDNARLDWTLPDDDILGRQDVIDEFDGTTITVDGTDPVAGGWETLDRVTTIVPTDGGDDVIYGNGNSEVGAGDVVFGGTGNDTIYGDTDEESPDGVDGVDGSDLLFGDHGKLYPSLATGFFANNNFFSIDTGDQDGANTDGVADGHKDFRDVIWGNAASDILIGGQDDDTLFGGTEDDDLIGGHNVAGGMDELDDMPGVDQLAIDPDVLADLNPADVNEINDILDGDADDDVLAGDNAIVIRQGGDLSPRFRVTANGLLYALESDTVDNLADVDVGFSADVTGARQEHQDMELVRDVTLLDHSEAIETAGADNPNQSRPFGNDVLAGGSEDDELFGQLGDDIAQGDGSIEVTDWKAEGSFDPYNPAQDADPSFDLRNFTQRIDLQIGNDTDFTLRFDVFEAADDGDDYLEGNGGNDRMYGNLGQDDIIGGSSSLFGLGDADALFQGVATGNDLRPDGADLIYGGAGNPDLLARNAEVEEGVNTIVPDAERHATDADTILGDNGDIYRIVVDADPETGGIQAAYATFNYDHDATTLYGFVDDGYGGAELTVRVRAVTFLDYGYEYADDGGDREELMFLDTARGEGDLIYGESGDDIVHGMTGDDVIFGNSEHDDLYGEIGNDFLLGGTGIDGIVGDDGLIYTSRNYDPEEGANADRLGESLYGIAALEAEETNLKRNEQPSSNSLNAVISTPGNLQRAFINVENELVKDVELFAFRTDDIEGNVVGDDDFSVASFNDIIFGGWQNDFIHAGDGDDAVSGAEALPAYYSGEGFGFEDVNLFLQDMQESTYNPGPDVRDNPFWFAFAPYNPGDILRYEGKEILDENGQRARTRDEFAWYDEFNPRRKVMFDFDFDFGAASPGDFKPLASDEGINAIDFILNFDETEGPNGPGFDGDDEVLPTDGADRLFGDLGNDWIVGGTGRDHMYGGRGDDLLNMDDNHDSGIGGRQKPKDPTPSELDNTQSDEYQAYADIAYSGAGRDVMILNTGADRAIDWVGEFNSYIVPFSPFGAFHNSRTLQPQLAEFLYALSTSDGIDARVDATTTTDTNTVDGQLYVDQKNADVRTDVPDPLRNFEPYGELGMVRQTDFDWQAQTGAPNDPQPGNLQGKREIMRRELFNDNQAAVPLAADVGELSITGKGTLLATPDAKYGEVVGLYPLDTLQPTYTEILVTVNADKDRAGSKSNGYVIFDYQGPEDFKFAGVDVGTDKLQIGHRDASGWVVDTQTQVQLRAGTDYDLTVVLFGSQATVYVNEGKNVSHDFGEPLNDGGMIGLGTDNATARFDDLQVQTLPPDWTFVDATQFNGPANNPLAGVSGQWNLAGGALEGGGSTANPAIAIDSVDVAPFSRLEILAELSSDGQAGLVFDYYGPDEFKYALLDVVAGEVVIGHFVDGQWYVDATAATDVGAGDQATLMVTLFGATASVTVDGQAVVTHTFNSILNDGAYGALSVGDSRFDSFLVRGDDPAFAGEPLLAAESVIGNTANDIDTSDIAVAAELARTAIADLAGVDTAPLEALAIAVDDLPGDYLALFQGDRIVVDIDAAGHGWHTGLAEPSAGIDLISALLHEYGHAVGLEHDSGLAFMAEELGVGQRAATNYSAEVLVLDEDTGELLDDGTAAAADDALLLDALQDTGEDTPEGLVQWSGRASISGRSLEHL